jgi:O-antigen ligase
MNERTYHGEARGAAIPGARFQTVEEWTGSSPVYDPAHRSVPLTTPVARLARIMLLMAIFFCGWPLLRVGDINLTASDILLALVVVIMLFRRQIARRPFGGLTTFWFLGLGLLLLGLLIGSVANGSVGRWVIVGAQYLFAFLLIPMVLMGQERPLTRSFPALFVLGVTISQLLGVSASLLFEPADIIPLMGNDFVTGNGRVGAMSGEPNVNGAMVAFALPMLLYSIRIGTIPTGLGILCGIVLLWGLLASGSFTGFSAALIAIALYLAISGMRILLSVSIFGAILAGLFMASNLPVPAVFEQRVAGALTSGDLNQAGTFTDRAELIEEAWEMADDNLLMGLGVDQYRKVSSHGAPVHELHLLILNEGGILAFAGLVMVLLTMLGLCIRALSRWPVEGAMILAVVAVFNVYTFAIPHMYARTWILPVLLAMSTLLAAGVPARISRRAG